MGTRVLVRLHGADVIHSFWVPKLRARPTRFPVRPTWLAARPGHRAATVGSAPSTAVLSTRTWGSRSWRRSRGLRALARAAAAARAPEPQAASQRRGLALVEYRCGACHTVRGTHAARAQRPGPHTRASRGRSRPGCCPTLPERSVAGSRTPQHIKPGSLMPNQKSDSEDLQRRSSSYLEIAAMRARGFPRAGRRHRQCRAPGATPAAVGGPDRA